MKSCVDCSLFFSCSKVQKIKGVICENYEDIKQSKSKKNKPLQIELKKESEINEEDKLRIPEEDLPLAKNIFDFVTGKPFLNLGKLALFPKQFEILVNFFSDYCPDCSNKDYLNRQIQVEDSFEYILDNVVLLEHDACPKCKKNKLDFLNENSLSDYYEMAGLAGQRCVTGDTLITCGKITGGSDAEEIAYVPIKDLVVGESDQFGFSPYKAKYFIASNLLHTALATATIRENTKNLYSEDALTMAPFEPLWKIPSYCFKSKHPEPVIEITAELYKLKTNIKGTFNHKIYCVNKKDYLTLQDLQIGDEIYYLDTDCCAVLTITQKNYLSPEYVYDLHMPLYHTYIANKIVSHNSGKSYISAISQAYTTHRFLKLKNPQETFGVSRATPLIGTFLALNKRQVSDSVWGYYKSLIDTSPWFLNFHEMLSHYGNKLGRKLVDYHNKESVEYLYKNIRIALGVPNSANLRGATRFQGGIDEIGWFDAEHDDKKTLSANELYAAISNSMSTIITKFEAKRKSGVLHLPTPTLINVSSPSHVRDKICTLVAQFKQEEKTTSSLRRYWFHYATWEINPDFPKDSVFIKGKYQADPLIAERDFGAKPPLSSNTFFSEKDNILKIFNGASNILSVEYSLTDPSYGYKYKIKGNLTESSRNRVMAIDLGYNDNSTAICIGFWDNQKSTIVCEAVCEIIPTKDTSVIFKNLTSSIIKPLIKQFNVTMVVCDKWQSLNLTQDLKETMRIETLTYSLKHEDFHSFKQLVLDQKIKLPMMDNDMLLNNVRLDNYPFLFHNYPMAHLYYQFLTVCEKDKNIRKGESATDDIFRTLVLLSYTLSNLEHRKKINQSRVMNNTESHVFLNGQSMKDKGGGSNFKFKGKNVFVS